MLTKECVWGVWKSERREKGGEKMEGGFIFFLWRKKKRRDDYFISKPTIFSFSKMGGNMRENVLNR